MDDFGTLEDWRELRAQMHRRGLRLIMDLVVNHTSDEHPWLVASRQSKENAYRDFYLCHPGKDGHEPNNWASSFGGSAWEYDAATGEYYLHLFSRKQADLNWENRQVRAAIYKMMHWWLRQDVDGFRMDVINMISKVPGLPDAPCITDAPYQPGGQYFVRGPRLAEYLQEMKQEVLSRYDLMTVGEMPMLTTAQAAALTHEENGYLNMVLQFEHMELDTEPGSPSKWYHKPLDLLDLKRVLSKWQKDLELAGWNSLYFSNHDQPRIVSRFGDDGQYRVESAKMLATCLHMLRGTPFIYQGEEIGMINVRFPAIDDYLDIETLNMYREYVEERGPALGRVMEMIYAKGRDNARTPMQWSSEEQAGFTTGTPWIKVNPNYTTINVARARSDPGSVLAYYQRLIRLRRKHKVIVCGAYELILDEHEQIYAFTRTLDDQRLLVLLNFDRTPAACVLPATLDANGWDLLLNNYPVDNTRNVRSLTLRPYEACVYLRT